MLVLTRKAKEEIRIGNSITVTIVRIKGQSVRIGINAPEHVHVMRSELVTRTDGETDSRGSRRPRCDGSASADGDSVADETASKQSADSPSDSSGETVDTAEADNGHSKSRADVAAQQPKTIRADEFGCQARQSPIGSTTAFTRVVARQRRNRLNQLLPPR